MASLDLVILLFVSNACFGYNFSDVDFHQLAHKMKITDETSEAEEGTVHQQLSDHKKHIEDHEKQLSEHSKLLEIQADQLLQQTNLIKEQALVISHLKDEMKQQTQIISQLEGKIVQKYQTLDNGSFNQNIMPMSAADEHVNASVRTKRNSNGSNVMVQSLKRSIMAEEPVAFVARKSTTQVNIGFHQNILFEDVMMNKGHGYHPQHGLFIAPQGGIYLISCSIDSGPDRIRVNVEIVRNGDPIARVYASENVPDQGSQTVLIDVQTGDEIWVRNWVSSSVTEVHGEFYSTFSGYLLWPM